ncbi:hypothetical protein F511_25058 [Dorcoceras hygrometricum]|uniref:Uncharacterized protein n=1 Tax=Dorcoceras hygrometricum TaxID=472368 RepID=A0A2Z7AML3_9LAMI|nr:hypothetical protein F511_25058 [Dorcoceras hygrometricum]
MAGSQNLKADQRQIATDNSGHEIKCPTHNIYNDARHTAASIITHAQTKALKQAHIRTSSLLSYNYHKADPSNTDHTSVKTNTDTSSGTVAQKLRIGSYELNQICPTLLEQQKALNKHKLQQAVPNEASWQEEFSASTLTSTRTFYRRQSEKIRLGEQYLGSWSVAKTSRSAFCNAADALVNCVVVAGEETSREFSSVFCVERYMLSFCEELLRLDDQSRAMVNAGQSFVACDWLCFVSCDWWCLRLLVLRLDDQSRAMVNAGQSFVACDWFCFVSCDWWCLRLPFVLFTVTFSGHFPSTPIIVLRVRGSVGLLSKSYFILYQSWKLRLGGVEPDLLGILVVIVAQYKVRILSLYFSVERVLDDCSCWYVEWLCPLVVSCPRPEARFLRQPALEELMRSTRTDSPRQIWPEQIPAKRRRRRRRLAAVAEAL